MFGDWKLTLGTTLTVFLAVCSVVSFVYAWVEPTPKDAQSAALVVLHYRFFAAFAVGTVSMASATMRYYQKRRIRF